MSQASLAIPLLVLYEGSIIAVAHGGKEGRRRQGRGHAAARQPAAARGQSGGVGHLRARSSAVIPRESGVSSTPRPLDFITASLEYWITRFRG